MLEPLSTCLRCGASLGPDNASCPRCGAARPGRSLMVAPAPWRQVAGPAAAGLAVAAAGVGLALVRRLMEQWVASHTPGPSARAKVEISDAPWRSTKARLIRRRFWAVGDRQGPRAWGLEETSWQHRDEGSRSFDSPFRAC